MSNSDNTQELNQLYIRFCSGDKKAQNTLYAMTSDRLYRYIMSKTNITKEVVAELMQETWIKLWKACSSDFEKVSFDKRMYTIASSLTIDYWRAEKKTKKRSSYEEALASEICHESDGDNITVGFNSTVSLNTQRNSLNEQVEWAIKADGIADDPGILYDLKKVIQALPLLQRQAWILKQEGNTNEEVALLTNSDVEAVRSRIRYASSKIKEIFT